MDVDGGGDADADSQIDSSIASRSRKWWVQ